MIRALFDHMQWADSVVWQAVLGTPAAEGDARLAQILQHLHATQRAFFNVWTGRDFRFAELMEPRDLRSLCLWAKDFHESCDAFLATVDERVMQSEMKLPWAGRMGLDREPAPTSMEETLIQVPAHSTYHRGQVNARLREIGGEPPLVDFIAWVWMGKPAPRWPA